MSEDIWQAFERILKEHPEFQGAQDPLQQARTEGYQAGRIAGLREAYDLFLELAKKKSDAMAIREEFLPRLSKKLKSVGIE